MKTASNVLHVKGSKENEYRLLEKKGQVELALYLCLCDREKRHN